MPIPAGAGVIAAIIHGFNGSWIDDWRIAIVWILLLCFVGFLMVCRWRFWSGKEVTSTGRHPFQMVILLALGVALILRFSEISLMVIALGYLVSGIVARLAYSWHRQHRTAR